VRRASSRDLQRAGTTWSGGDDLSGPRRPHVLLVEDDEYLVQAMEPSLRVAYELTVARDGHEALSLGPAAFDVILTDLVLPVMSGDAFKEQLDDLGIRVPVIFISGTDELPERAARARPFAFLAKPFSPRQLEQVIARALESGAAARRGAALP
jgi:CheY-like chemotaxis protein